MMLNDMCSNAQVEMDFDNDADVRVMLLVHDTKPPFIDGRVLYTKQTGPVLPLKDPTSDMAVIARQVGEDVTLMQFWDIVHCKGGDHSLLSFWPTCSHSPM